MPTLWETPTVPGLWRKRPITKKPTERKTMSFAIRPVAYMPHSRGQEHRMSRPAEGSGARAPGPAWGGRVSQSLFSGAVGHRGGHVPRAGWDSWLCCARSAVLVGAESGKPGQRDGEQGAPLQGPICGGYLGGWEQRVGLRQKPSPALCVHPHPWSFMSIQAQLAWKDGRNSAGGASSPSPTCTYLQEAVLKVLAGVWMVL